MNAATLAKPANESPAVPPDTIESRLRANLPKIREWLIDRIADAAVKKLNSIEPRKPER
jgi:hypothetical protein